MRQGLIESTQAPVGGRVSRGARHAWPVLAGLIFLLACGSLAPAASAGVPPDVAARKGQAILGRMNARFTALQDFTARVEARVKLSLLPRVGLSGKVYYKRPDKVKVELEDLPSWVDRFRDSFSGLTPTQRDKSEYVTLYDGDETLRGTPCHRLVVRPKNVARSNVRDIHLWVDQKECTILRATVSYNDGASVASDTTYATVHGFMLPARQESHIATRHAAADVSAVFSDYAINQKLPDSVFKGHKS